MKHVGVHEYGSAGPAVVLLHGTPSSSEDFSPLAQELSTTHRVLVLDLPGYRGAAPLEGGERFVVTRQLIGRALRDRGIEAAAFVGFSGGALRAVDLVINGGVRATHLITLAGYVAMPRELLDGVLQLAPVLRAGVDLRAALPGRMCSPGFLERHPEAARTIEGWLDAVSPAVLADELESFGEFLSAIDLGPGFERLQLPVTAIAGELDQAVPPGLSEQMKARNPGVRLELLPAAGHALLLEEPATVTRLIRETLALS